MEDSEIEVMSEIHFGCQPATGEPCLSRFTFSFPFNDHCISVDKDGDLLLPRRNNSSRSAHSFTVTIQHSLTSTLPRVGLQVWKAQLVLSEFVLHKIYTSSDFHGIVSLELGAGTGLLGILLAQVAKAVFLTGAASLQISLSTCLTVEAISYLMRLFCFFPRTIDHGDEILGNCAKNVEMNSSLINPLTVVNIRELNWMSEWPIQESHGYCKDPEKYRWSSQDLEQVKNASFIFAADVIYSDDLTIALFSTLERVMSFGFEKVLYLGLEKRYNFSLDDLNVVANGYACFRSYIKEDGLCEKEKGTFVGKRIDITQMHHYMKDFDRGEDIELWEIRYVF